MMRRFLVALILTMAPLAASDFRIGQTAARDGVPIVYEVRGEGSPALVFVHCWACDRSFWDGQIEAFAKRHLVISIDLPGHGASGTERSQWTLEGLADDVRAVAESLDLRRIILVGHSMGGPVALLAAPKLGDRLIGIVSVDTLHNAELQPPAQMLESMAALYESDFEGTMRRIVPQMFPKDADSELVERVIVKAAASPSTPALALLRAFAGFDAKQAFASAGVPIRGINAAPAPEGGVSTEVDINRKYADYDAVLMDGVGHYLMMERPAEFNRHLEAAIESIVRGSRD